MTVPSTLELPFSKDLITLLTALRRHLHKHPEVTWQEFQTQATIQTYLIEHAGIAPKTFTGSILLLRCVAFRGDMDALPMTERNPHLEYASSNAAHIASTAQHERPPPLPAPEEGGFGAVKMIEDRGLDGVDEVCGYHNGPFLLNTHYRLGTSSPHQTQDPVLAAGHIIVAIQSVLSQSVAAQESAIISITQVHGGEADDVIPSRVTLSGTIRDFSPDTSRLTVIATHTAAATATP
ncbi:hypothetical protein SPRG_07239 [Saprolegnia parasitica CBS 223.65]|uniref:Peptidase M20 dimerisation domain-containing protein n=1 Tax=Saprolegnia parasitica (strain CBS 223.65) TaxID=695850 RepID=A0A067CBS4_SAPPC|nr:hypothetical protein SPRG_07239 [Saprolegnia parasitica CBS 223.65]KDO27963.1 hypothetical protein SPRG_07239 [Saprolegnia parasitica CBS 223.65]|eukprot:XP_012201413.1 hypothetical protein SPRG_07239 [Saprolegnia parasitica CBS 223.65]